MLIAYKTEIDPTAAQKTKINQTIGVSRLVYNMFVSENKDRLKHKKPFIFGMDFSKWLNNVFIPENPDKSWIKDVSSKSVKQSIMNADRALKGYIEKKSGFPCFKKKNEQQVKMYFVKNDAKTTIKCKRHKIAVPTLGWVRIKEKGYIPTNALTHIIKSGTISQKADRYYISVLVEQECDVQLNNSTQTDGIGIDLGIKEFAVMSNGTIKRNINKTTKTRKLEKKLKREQRCLSRKYKHLKKEEEKNNEKGKATRKNIKKQVVKVQKIHQKLTNIRQDYRNQTAAELVKTKPAYVTIEDLNVSGMMKNRHLSKAIAQQGFYDFRTRLTNKAHRAGIEVRVVNRFYGSSKICSKCGNNKSDLKLSDRIYHCTECGVEMDRDMNAAFNLKNAKKYKIV